MLISLKNVSKFYYTSNTVAAGFTNLSVDLDIGEFVVVTGQSGSGKSTLLNVISGLDNYQEGEMYVNGEDTSGYSNVELENYRKKYIANIFQSFNLINSYSVYRNIAYSMMISGEKVDKKKIIEVLDKVGLLKYRYTKASKLSGGQKQRVAIARALVKNTPIIVADEPTGDLDEKSAREVLKLFSEISKDKLVIVVTHNYSQIEQYATRKLQMSDGHIIEDIVLKDKNKSTNAINVVENKKMKLSSIIKLSFVNAFNILPKFLLTLAVFAFVVVSTVGLFSAYKQTEKDSLGFCYSYYFNDVDNRFIVKNKDKSALSEDIINKIKNNELVDYIDKNDMFIEDRFYMFNDNSWLYGDVLSINQLKDYQSTNLSDKDVVLAYGPEDYWIENYLEDNRFYLTFDSDYYYDNKNIDSLYNYHVVDTIVDDSLEYNYIFYVSDSCFNELRLRWEVNKASLVLNYEDSVLFLSVMPCDFVKEGEVYLFDSDTYYLSDKSILNKEINIDCTSLYYSSSTNLKITKLINNDNYAKVFGNNKDYANGGLAFINQKDYESLFNLDTYQLSVFIKDSEDANDFKAFLQDLDVDYLYVSDACNSFDDFDVIELLFVGFTILIALIILYFIAFLVIRLIMKSRNTYFATTRILGASVSNIKQLIIGELLVVMNVTIVILSIVLIFVKVNYYAECYDILEIIENFKILDYLLLYVVLNIMTILIGGKYSKNLFKQSAISTLKEHE